VLGLSKELEGSTAVCTDSAVQVDELIFCRHNFSLSRQCRFTTRYYKGRQKNQGKLPNKNTLLILTKYKFD
jgi:hypothetical protein